MEIHNRIMYVVEEHFIKNRRLFECVFMTDSFSTFA